MSKPLEPESFNENPTSIEASAQADASAHVDVVSSATVWHLGRERDPQVPLPGVPYTAADKADGALRDAASAYVASKRHGTASGIPAEGRAPARRGRIGIAIGNAAHCDADTETSATRTAGIDVTTGATQASDADAGAGTAQALDVDTAAGATPGVASAFRELGLSSTSEVTRRLGIRPPGVR